VIVCEELPTISSSRRKEKRKKS